MVQFRLTDPEPMLFHNEALVRDGRIVSTVTSANYGHALGGAVGMAYVPCAGESAAEVLASTYQIEIAGRRHAASPRFNPCTTPAAKG
jgi:glycine cleavage system aminomethyltransferase T